jgi:hypothetical protein
MALYRQTVARTREDPEDMQNVPKTTVGEAQDPRKGTEHGLWGIFVEDCISFVDFLLGCLDLEGLGLSEVIERSFKGNN